MRHPYPEISTKRGFRAPSGFSLIEVTLSIAIVAVAVLPLTGMFSMALKANRRSADRAIISQIVDEIGRDLEQSDFSNFPATIPVYHFDEQGVRVGVDSLSRIFTAKARIEKGVGIPASSGAITTGNLARLMVDVAINPGNIALTELFKEDDAGALTHPATQRFTLFVARND